MVWDGTKLVNDTIERTPVTSAKSKGPPGLKWFWWTNGIFCLAVAIFFLVRLMRRALGSR